MNHGRGVVLFFLIGLRKYNVAKQDRARPKEIIPNAKISSSTLKLSYCDCLHIFLEVVADGCRWF